MTTDPSTTPADPGAAAPADPGAAAPAAPGAAAPAAPIDPREFRNALGQFATGVCVITAHPEGWQPFGVTVNSFASVSLDPPLVLWSLQNNSELFAAFEAAGSYAVNILRADQQALADQYAKRGDHHLHPAHHATGASGLPVMPDTLVSLECDIDTRHHSGDHVILIGRVRAMAHRQAGQPLLFCAGAYRQLAGGA